MLTVDSLDSWLEVAVERLSQQQDKLRIFHERQVYSEYWVQNELATVLPWDQPGIYVVDCGPALALPAGVSKFPDFCLQFGRASDGRLYLVELKDLLTNAARNVSKLQVESAVMAKMNRAETKERWRTHNGKAANYARQMTEALESASLVFCGMAVGAREDVPPTLTGFRGSVKHIGSDWALGFYELTDQAAALPQTIEPELEFVELEETSDAIGAEDMALATCLEAAYACERQQRQIAPELPISSRDEARQIIRRAEAMLSAYNKSAQNPIIHAKPWLWTPGSSGSAMTEAGRVYAVEIRFSYTQRPVR